MTSSYRYSPITLTRTVVEDSPSPPTALNDTQKLGVVTVETLPPDTTALDLTRIRLLLDQGSGKRMFQHLDTSSCSSGDQTLLRLNGRSSVDVVSNTSNFKFKLF